MKIEDVLGGDTTEENIIKLNNNLRVTLTIVSCAASSSGVWFYDPYIM